MAKRRVRFLHRPPVRWLFAVLTAAYLRLVWRSCRWRAVADPEATALIRDGRTCIGAFWHGRLTMIAFLWRRMLREAGRDPRIPAYVLISAHGDGAMMADAAARIGARVVRGSSRHGGAPAYVAMRRAIEDGSCMAIATDGPTGPRLRVKPGALHLARATGAPIIPLAFATSSQRVLSTWDRFALPLPFARGVLAWGRPLLVPPETQDDELETLRKELEARLLELTDEADQAFGHAPVG